MDNIQNRPLPEIPQPAVERASPKAQVEKTSSLKSLTKKVCSFMASRRSSSAEEPQYVEPRKLRAKESKAITARSKDAVKKEIDRQKTKMMHAKFMKSAHAARTERLIRAQEADGIKSPEVPPRSPETISEESPYVEIIGGVKDEKLAAFVRQKAIDKAKGIDVDSAAYEAEHGSFLSSRRDTAISIDSGYIGGEPIYADSGGEPIYEDLDAAIEKMRSESHLQRFVKVSDPGFDIVQEPRDVALLNGRDSYDLESDLDSVLEFTNAIISSKQKTAPSLKGRTFVAEAFL